ncbi:MAG: phosphoribosylformylglycinamidine synthase subunit PurQ [Candidatus Margulisiibacteriota bacterium]
MKFGVIVFPGSNCDHDCYHVLKNVFNQPTDYIWHKESDLDSYDCIVVPGGFSYGDYLRAGAIARFSPIMESLNKFANKGKYVIGICNGFQVLVESHLLPGALQRNDNLKFICKPVCLRVENNKTPFTANCSQGQVIEVPIAHGEGNYFADPETIDDLLQNDQVVFRYSDASGKTTPQSNPNGSLESIAGICNKKRNVLGMMPHPERASEKVLGSTDGKFIFQSIIDSIQ